MAYEPSTSHMQSPERALVKAAAQRHSTLEAALMPMIHAAGVHGPAAEAVKHAYLNDEHLFAQAVRAYESSR